MPMTMIEDDAGEFRYRITARNGEIMATSEGYTRAGDAARGFADLKAELKRMEAAEQLAIEKPPTGCGCDGEGE